MMIRTSDSVAAISAAIVKAQAEMPGAPKDTKGQVGNQVRFYADLTAVVDAARPVLAAHGLAYVQFPSDYSSGTVVVTTRLLHSSGEWMEADLPMPTGQNGAQGVGSAITYAKRYALMAVLGMASEDDDGGAASKPARKPPPAKAAPAPRHATATQITDGGSVAGPSEAQIKKMQAQFNELGLRDRQDRLAFIAAAVRPVESSKDLAVAEASTVIDTLTEAIAGTIALVWTGAGAIELTKGR